MEFSRFEFHMYYIGRIHDQFHQTVNQPRLFEKMKEMENIYFCHVQKFDHCFIYKLYTECKMKRKLSLIITVYA